MHILYLAHDLADAAIRRRVLMLTTGGAKVTVAGFQRAENLLAGDPAVCSITLGRTADARFLQRMGAVASTAFSLKAKLQGVAKPDVIIARNLEMLALAGRAARLFGGDIPIVYESLDIHRLLLDEGMTGRMFRSVEGYFGRNARLLVTSSPAFVESYFARRSQLDLPTLLLENKVLDLDGAVAPVRPASPKPGEPWRIGWFGAIRCRKSLAILSEFAREMNGSVEIVLRGRPATSEFDAFERQVADAPFVEFHGAYRYPEDLSSIYSQVQFVWAIDYFEEGLNSNWLLPNRLYEGSLHGAVPIALKSTETGRFLDSRRIGLTLDDGSPAALVRQFETMTDERHGRLQADLAAVDRSTWVAGPEDCRALVARLANLQTRLSGARAPVSSPAIGTGR
ncbi:glycosyltransferase [Rhizobium halophytocola]|uniref:Succinoglycan biosynthesis protein ExoL n=1 Tax=Rhizobium halophytocola TaxID=735519 RepID=A0ABS4E4T8_9HYPH|nr:glycosyltransferase [Rhizobium halophytocola]MBP1852955.1 succinoglycan biosynthesis protein ExoL [Rhizobium halophytocola]